MAASRRDFGNFVNISDDEDDELPFNQLPPNPAFEEFIVIEDDDEEGPAHRPHAHQETRPRPTRTRNEAPRWPETYVDQCKLTNETAQALGPTAATVKIGDTVEVRTSQLYGCVKDGDFLRIMKIIENHHCGKIKLRGLLLRRNRYLKPMLKRTLNEVHIVQTLDSDDPRPDHVQGLEEIPLAMAFKKRKLRVTNLPYPLLSFRGQTRYNSSAPNAKQMERSIADNDVLVCRYAFAHIYGKGDRNRARLTPWQGVLRLISAKEADDTGGILSGRNIDHVESDDDDVVVVDNLVVHGPSRPRQYTYADGFQGAGGASCAAQLAGLKVVWGFDNNPIAVTTASRNFRRARIIHCEAADFPPLGFCSRCDIMHLSPPCQPFSQVNTNPNPLRDEVNTAALLAVGKIIGEVKPRIVTLEEVPGLLTRKRHQPWFGILIEMIIEKGYSVRWAIMNVLEYGVSQPRHRLVLIAAAPGIPLPEMPAPTHGEPGSGPPDYVTARQAIGRFPRGTTHHNPEQVNRIQKDRWNPDEPYFRTITCSNSENYHWSGTRKFTNRELAGLQSFPHSHMFSGSSTDVQKQIGNAVPPQWFKHVFEQCIKVLRKVDGLQGGHAGNEEADNFVAPSRTMSPVLPPSSQDSMGSSADNAIVIDDDDTIDID